MSEPVKERELEVPTVANMLGVSYNTVRRLMERRELRWTWRGTRKGYRVFESSVREFKARRDAL
ncbi:MAG: helix-turn-helix domain-containing protein [Thermodesulfobacteriota bacterium]|jgi:excisionase family DNA binding protein